jgi:hypothetical protein
MAAMTDRQAARERLLALAKAQIDKLIPADESVPLRGQFFADFEDQADELERTVCPAFLEERVALSAGAQVAQGGICPHCGSDRVYLESRVSQVELLTPHGMMPMSQQHARCRSCDRSFSPSEARPEPAGRGPALDARGGEGGDRGGDRGVRHGGGQAQS